MQNLLTDCVPAFSVIITAVWTIASFRPSEAGARVQRATSRASSFLVQDVLLAVVFGSSVSEMPNTCVYDLSPSGNPPP